MAEASRILLGVWGRAGWRGTSCSASPPTTVCTPFGLSIMFTVTGKLLVKPRVRHPPHSPSAPALGVTAPRAAWFSHLGPGEPFMHPSSHSQAPHPSLAPGRPG